MLDQERRSDPAIVLWFGSKFRDLCNDNRYDSQNREYLACSRYCPLHQSSISRRLFGPLPNRLPHPPSRRTVTQVCSFVDRQMVSKRHESALLLQERAVLTSVP